MRRCSGVTQRARMCRAGGTVRVLLTDGREVWYCKPHWQGRGIMRMLLPHSWEIRQLGHVPFTRG